MLYKNQMSSFEESTVYYSLWDYGEFHSDFSSNPSTTSSPQSYHSPYFETFDSDNNNTYSDPANKSYSYNPSGEVSNDEEEQLVKLTTSWILIAVLSLLIIVTVIGNVLVCLSVILVRKLRKPQNYLLVSLATSDLFVAIFVMPFAIISEFYSNEWPLNRALCDLWVSADVLCCTASILNLCGISVDRYHAITFPLEYSAKASPRKMLIVIFFVWLSSACVSLPPVLLLGNEHVDHEDPTIPICTVSQNFWYQIYATMASFYVPLCVMVVVYVKILGVVADKKREMSSKLSPAPKPKPDHRKQHCHSNAVLLKSTKTLTITTPGNQFKSSENLLKIQNGSPSIHPTTKVVQQGNKGNSTCYIFKHPIKLSHRLKKEKILSGLREHKASTTLGIIMSAFICCWLPFFVLALVRPFSGIYHIDIPGWVSSLFLWLGYANSALNPVIYATLNRDFRRPFKEILCFRCSKLDAVMRREYYNHQFGTQSEIVRHKQLIVSKIEDPFKCDDNSNTPTLV